MSKYHLYGVGNALVDMEFEISLEQLELLGVDKGLMTLIDQEQQDALFAKLADYPTKRACGGSAANTMIALAQLGGKSFYSCKVASDETGDFYLNDLKANGVDSNLDTQPRQTGVTGKCAVMTTPDADRSMNTFLGITEHFSSSELNPAALQNAEFYYMEGYLVTSPTGRAAAIEGRKIAEEAGVKTALTLSDPNMVNFFRDGLLEMAGEKLDILFSNRDEALLMSGQETLEAATENLHKIARVVVITDGSDGALCSDGEELYNYAAVPTQAVDSNGAGDMFAGAFLYGLTHGLGYQKSGELAAATASQLVSQLGPRLKLEQTKDILSTFNA